MVERMIKPDERRYGEYILSKKRYGKKGIVKKNHKRR